MLRVRTNELQSWGAAEVASTWVSGDPLEGADSSAGVRVRRPGRRKHRGNEAWMWTLVLFLVDRRRVAAASVQEEVRPVAFEFELLDFDFLKQCPDFRALLGKALRP